MLLRVVYQFGLRQAEYFMLHPKERKIPVRSGSEKWREPKETPELQFSIERRKADYTLRSFHGRKAFCIEPNPTFLFSF
ncbi:hypothetical protein RRG08_060948 [Elysia crispata]|uniref:Uncharacterized protein n=1 Tax=Elysia crispata TaxID=231223 RepID=A0AAE1E645_9GAST|nr:hypothetical protein RRG08_060948 [Elysia crispata]